MAAGKIIRRSLLVLLAVLLVAAAVLWLMVSAKPADFVEDFHGRGAEDISRLATAAQDRASRMVESLQHNQAEVTAEFGDIDLTAVLHQFVLADPTLVPQGISSPQVHFHAGRMVLMAKLTWGGVQTVIGAECSPKVDEAGRLTLGTLDLKAGVLPMPQAVLDVLTSQLDRHIEQARRDSRSSDARLAADAADRLAWLTALRTLIDGGTVDTAAVPALKRDGYRVSRIELTEGTMSLAFSRLEGN